MKRLSTVLLITLAAVGCSAPSPQPNTSAPLVAPTVVVSSAPVAAPAAVSSVTPQAPGASNPPGFVEAEFGEISRDGFGEGRHLVFIRGGVGTVPGGMDDLTFDFIERFRTDRKAAIAWSENQPELAKDLAIARQLVRAHYELEGDSFYYRLFGKDGPIEAERPQIVILVSGAPFFIELEALEGFGY